MLLSIAHLISLDVWTHGDFVSIHPVTRQLFFHGRADGVLNPSGVRFGSSEIYQVLEAEFPNELVDSLCVGQRRPRDTDERVMLFLLLKPGVIFNPELVARVKTAIRQKLSSRHVPSFIFETSEIPVRTVHCQACGCLHDHYSPFLSGHRQRKEGRIAGQADRVREAD